MSRLLVVDTSPCLGGATTSLAALLPLMVAKGWAVQVIAYHRGPLQCARSGIMARHQGGLWWHTVPPEAPKAMHGLRYVNRELRRAAALHRTGLKMGATLIMANNGPLDNAGAGFAARQLSIPLVQYIRGPFYAGRLARPALGLASLVLTVGAEARAAVRMNGVDASKIYAVDEGLDARQWPSLREGDRFLWAGVLTKWKGLELMLDAWRDMERVTPDPALDICYVPMPSGHPDADPLPAAPPGVCFHRSPADLDAIRRQCAVYVHTSLRPEPFGRTIIEAMAAGLCPVVPDTGSGTRLVEHGVSGMVYRAGDRDSLRRTLSVLAQDVALRTQLGLGAAHAGQYHRADTVFDGLIEQLSRLAAGGTRKAWLFAAAHI